MTRRERHTALCGFYGQSPRPDVSGVYESELGEGCLLELVAPVVPSGGISLNSRGVIAFTRALLNPRPYSQTSPKPEASGDLEDMNEAANDNGPEDYSLMTSYPDSYCEC